MRTLIGDTRSETTGMTENETGEIEVATKKAQGAQEETETIEEIETAVIEMIVEDGRIATGEIDHVLETEAREEIGMIVVDEMIGIMDEIDAIEETLKWKNLARPDEMIAETREDMMIAEEIGQTMIPEENCTAQLYHVLGKLKK